MVDGKLKVFKTYLGGKEASGSYQKIINEIRPHDVYMELFLGNGTVFRYKRKAAFNYLNDFDSTVIDAWKNNCSTDNTVYTISNAIEFLRNFKFNPQLRYCIYLDPPYVHSTRKSSHRYNCEMSDDEHIVLLKVIKNLPSNVDVLISTYKNDIYSELLKDWRLITYNSKTRQSVEIEYLYMNYNNQSGILYDYSYLGEDYIDRQRIKRKIESAVNKLAALPAIERNAIINALRELDPARIDKIVCAYRQV